MPHRLVCVGILVLWAVSAGMLLSRDVLPDLLISAPPDMRAITRSRAGNKETKWSILLSPRDGKSTPVSIGQASTKVVQQQDGYVKLTSRIWFDSETLFSGTPLAKSADRTRIEIQSLSEFEPGGDLSRFRAAVRPVGSRIDWMVLSGLLNVNRNGVGVTSTGVLPMFNWKRTFPYPRHGMIQNSLDPFEKMPGLQVGQRWRTQVMSPLTGQFQTASVEVSRKQILEWNSTQIEATEVVTRIEPFAMRTWVRSDGLVVRQQVPLPMTNLMLERIADPDDQFTEKIRP